MRNQLHKWPDWATSIIKEVHKAGTYTKGLFSQRRGEGWSINDSLIAYDESQGLAIIQVRLCMFRRRRHNHVRKNYYLIGRNENENVFAHPIRSPLRFRVSMESLIARALADTWGCSVKDLPRIIRQGDVGLLPKPLPKHAVRLAETELILRESHKLTGTLYLCDGKHYVANPTLVHLKGQHSTQTVRSDGHYLILMQQRAQQWDFSTPLSD